MKLTTFRRRRRVAIKRFIYSQLSMRDGLFILLGRAKPLVQFKVEAKPASLYFNFEIDPFPEADSTHTLGPCAGLRKAYLGWAVTFSVRNATDEDVWAVGFDVPTVGGHSAYQLPPRSYGATLRVRC